MSNQEVGQSASVAAAQELLQPLDVSELKGLTLLLVVVRDGRVGSSPHLLQHLPLHLKRFELGRVHNLS